MLYLKYEELYDAGDWYTLYHEYRNDLVTSTKFDEMIGTPAEIYAASEKIDALVDEKDDEINQVSLNMRNKVVYDFYHELFLTYALPVGIDEDQHEKILKNMKDPYDSSKKIDNLTNYYAFDNTESEYIRFVNLVKEFI